MRLLKTQISKKFNLSSKKYQLTDFSRTMEYEKPQAAFHEGSQGILTSTVEVITSLFLGPKRLLKTKFFRNNGNLSSEKKIDLFSLCVLQVRNVGEKFIHVQKFF